MGGGAGSGQAGSGGASGAGSVAGSAGSSGSEYRVTIDASRTMLCSGGCAELSALAENGNEPYAFAWSGDLGDGPGPHEVCPDETTTYSVVASDTAVYGEEFGRPSRDTSASIEVRVDEGCVAPDGGTDGDAGIDEVPGTSVLCSIAISYGEPNWISTYSGWEGNSNLATDAEGNLYVAGAVQGTLDVGGTTITSVGIADALLLKYDPECKLVWAKTYGTQSAQIGFGAIAVGPDGTIVVGGAISGDADLGIGPISSGFSHSGMLVKIDPDDGAVIWNQVYTSFLNTVGVWDVGIDDAGDIVFAGHAASDVSFGGAPLGGEQSGNIAFLARLSSSGAHRFSFAIQNTDLVTPFAIHGSGVIAMSGWTNNSSVLINTVPLELGEPMKWKRYVAMLNERGELLWGRALGGYEDVEDGQLIGWWAGSLALDSDRNVVIEHGLYSQDETGVVEEWPESISKLDPNGTTLWTKDFSPEEPDRTFYTPGGLAIDSQGNVLHSDELALESAAAPGATDAGVEPGNRLYVQKLTPEGDVVWRHWFDEAQVQWTWGIAIGPDDAVWLALSEEHASSPTVVSVLSISKLAP